MTFDFKFGGICVWDIFGFGRNIGLEYWDFAIMRQPPALCKCCVPRGDAIRVLNMMMVIIVIMVIIMIFIKEYHKVGEYGSYLGAIS